MTRQEIENALDKRNNQSLQIRMKNGRYWDCRRNGVTKTWKTRPNDFSIPFKYGFKFYGRITHTDLSGFDAYFRIMKPADFA